MAAFLYEFEWDPVKGTQISTSMGWILRGLQRCFSTHSRLPSWTKSTANPRLGGLHRERMRAAIMCQWSTLFEWLPNDRGRVRLISARRPTGAEIRDYQERI